MKCAVYLTSLFLTTIVAAPAQPSNAEDALRALTKLYEIDVQADPVDGSVKGIRIRRNKGTEGALPAETEEYLLPELDIQKINDEILSVNGVRIKRGDFQDLSDVSLEKELTYEALKTDQRLKRDGYTYGPPEPEYASHGGGSGSGPDTLLGFLSAKLKQKLSSIASASAGVIGGASNAATSAVHSASAASAGAVHSASGASAGIVSSASGASTGFIGSASSSSSGGSSGGHGEPEDTYGPPHDSYGPPQASYGAPHNSYGTPHQSYDDKSFNFLDFKRSILNTLLQAVKAIKGGVIALGGQIIKAKGQIISTAGKIVATKGDAISSFGRNIASNALLSPPANHGSTSYANEHVGEGPYPSHDSYTLPSYTQSGPSGSFGEPAPSHGYNKRGTPAQQQHQQQFAQHDIPNGLQAGLLVLKPIDRLPDPRGLKTFNSRQDYRASSQQFKPLPPVVSDSDPGSDIRHRELMASPSEHRPYFVENIQHSNGRGYFFNY